MIDISVVIPTCNRPERLLSVLRDLDRSSHRVAEVLVVDSSDRKLGPDAFAPFPNLRVSHLEAPRSVCVQRNIGIRRAEAPWIFLCDDDIEVPADYLDLLAAHLAAHPECGAVSGLFRERQGADGEWVGQFPERSWRAVLWKTVFQLGMWGEIRGDGLPARWLAERYRRRGNHLSRAGWPVITEMNGPFFRTPVYSLGASLVKREWLLASPYDESLDSHGMGDNYGVAIGFPAEGIHVLNGTGVRHHREQTNRLPEGTSQERRLLALDYFIRSRRDLKDVSPAFFLWSLVGGGILHALSGNLPVSRSMWTALGRVALGRNPYLRGGARAGAVPAPRS